MDKERILEAARNEKYRGAEYEDKEIARSSLLGCSLALFVGAGLFLLEFLVNNSANIGIIAVCTTMAGAQSIYEGVKVKKLRLTILGALLSLLAVCSILAFIGWVVLA